MTELGSIYRQSLRKTSFYSTTLSQTGVKSSEGFLRNAKSSTKAYPKPSTSTSTHPSASSTRRYLPKASKSTYLNPSNHMSKNGSNPIRPVNCFSTPSDSSEHLQPRHRLSTPYSTTSNLSKVSTCLSTVLDRLSTHYTGSRSRKVWSFSSAMRLKNRGEKLKGRTCPRKRIFNKC